VGKGGCLLEANKQKIFLLNPTQLGKITGAVYRQRQQQVRIDNPTIDLHKETQGDNESPKTLETKHNNEPKLLPLGPSTHRFFDIVKLTNEVKEFSCNITNRNESDSKRLASQETLIIYPALLSPFFIQTRRI
jgi:hypothetical protein